MQSEVRIVGASAWNPPPSAKKGALRSASVTKSGGVGSGMTSWFGAARSPSASSVQVASPPPPPPPPPVAGATLAPTLASPPMMSATMKIATGGLASSSEDNAPLGTAITSTLASEAAATSGYASPTAASSAASAAETLISKARITSNEVIITFMVVCDFGSQFGYAIISFRLNLIKCKCTNHFCLKRME